MKIFLKTLLVALALAVVPAQAADSDYLDRMAYESEIKSIAVVSRVQRMGAYADGTFLRVTFRTEYSVTPFTPKTFVGGCKSMESGWQKRSPGTIYFNPKPGQKVFVTVTSNGGAITSLTPMTPVLDSVVRSDPARLAFSKGRAEVVPTDD